MLLTWLERAAARWREHRERSAIERRPIPDDLWKRTLARYPFLRRRDPADEARLRQLTSLFLDRKEFSASPGQRLTNDVVVAIAAQACLPVLRLGLARYEGFVGIVVHPDQVVARREVHDEDGIVHRYDEVLAGEAVAGGPVMLSWRDVRSAGAGYNVVIHEFAHVLDMEDGLPDGVPLLPPDLPRTAWLSTLEREYESFAQRVERDEPTALDPYAAHGHEEFFAVASESFFADPEGLLAEHPAWYELLRRFYRQDPARETPPRRARHGP
jgi:Mlc titration factor MtfA (ptsG expression regulator)